VLALPQADVCSGAARVDALVDVVPEADAALALVLTGAQPENVRVLRVDRDATHRVGAVVVEMKGIPPISSRA